MATSDLAQIRSAAAQRVGIQKCIGWHTSYVFDFAEKRGYGIQGDARAVAAFLSAIHIGYPHPGNHACQTCSLGSGLVVGVFARSEWNVIIVVRRRCSVREWARPQTAGEKEHKKGHENVPFWVLDDFVEIRATLLERMAGTTGLEPAASAVTGQQQRVNH